MFIWVDVGSRNLIPFPYLDEQSFGRTFEQRGVVVTIQDDGGIHLKGTATQDMYVNLSDIRFAETNLAITKPDTWNTATDGNVCLSISGTAIKNSWCGFDANNNKTFISVRKGVTVDGVAYVMLNRGDTPLPYEPYKPTKEYRTLTAYYNGRRISLNRYLFEGAKTLASLNAYTLSQLNDKKLSEL